MLTPYPQIVEYNEAVQHPASVFRDPELRQGRVKMNALGLPVVLSGGFALTYLMATPRRRLALRCFHRDITAGEHKYAAIARTLKTLHSPYFVAFDYLADGIRIRGGYYPVLKMDWAEGDPLGIWLERHAGERRRMARLRAAFAALADFLEANGVAHGDIQNGNVIVSRAGLKLVDYDGMYVPGMPAEFGCESGHKHFQHPRRSPAHFGPAIDRFSFIVVDLSLAALIDDPSLHRRFCQGGETILFRAGDFAAPERSALFSLLAQRRVLRPAVENFAAVCRGDIAAVPTLADFRAGRNIPSAAAAGPVSATVAVGTISDGANRRLVARLLGQQSAAVTAAAAPTVRAAPIGRRNQAIVRALRGRAAAPQQQPAPASRASLRQPVPPLQPSRHDVLSPRASVWSVRPARLAMPKSGSVVIHPRNRAAPAAPAAATHSAPPTAWQRVLRFLGFDG